MEIAACPVGQRRTSALETSSAASTDVGSDDERRGDECLSARSNQEIYCQSDWLPSREATGRPRFAKVDKQQRLNQLANIVEEFCTLDFNSVDAVSQEAVVLRMLALLKCLIETTSFYEHDVHHAAARLSLLDISEADQKFCADVVGCAQKFCGNRNFRQAFDVLRHARPRLLGKDGPPTPEQDGDAEALQALRRAQKRQRQRQERREARAMERARRSAARGHD